MEFEYPYRVHTKLQLDTVLSQFSPAHSVITNLILTLSTRSTTYLSVS